MSDHIVNLVQIPLHPRHFDAENFSKALASAILALTGTRVRVTSQYQIVWDSYAIILETNLDRPEQQEADT